MAKLLKTYAMARPEVEFRFGGKVFYRTSLPERLFQVLGVELKEVREERVRLFYSKEEGGVRQVFVNKRPVELPEVEKVLEEKRVKSFVLFVEVEPEVVDFNLSPTKERVLIEDEGVLREVEELLREEFSLPKVFAVREGERIVYRSPIELLGSDGTVIVGADAESYYFFDQHLISERVNYERLLKMLKERKVPKVKVHPPVELPKSARWKLEELGIDYEEVGERLVVREIPEILEASEVKELHLKSPDSVAEVACKRALKAGYRVVNWREVEELFKEFLRCENRETCPHGRPIYYKIDKKRVFKQLGRKLK
jgi:DNA mismatch repair protein MutL